MSDISWASIYQSGGSVFAVIKKVLRGEGTPGEEYFVSTKVSKEDRLAVAIMSLADIKNSQGDRVIR